MQKEWFAAVVLLCSTACKESSMSEVCTREAPFVRITPTGRSLAVGATYAVKAIAVACSGQHTTPFTGIWSSENAAVATVASTGLARAVGRGSTDTQATYARAAPPPAQEASFA